MSRQGKRVTRESGRPKKAGKQIGRYAFTLVEIMIVVCILGLIAAIAAPNFVKARHHSQAVLCTQWLERIDGAKAQIAFAERMRPTQIPSDTAIIKYIQEDRVINKVDGATDLCPAGGFYRVNDIATHPSCSMAEAPGLHQLR